jgi:hypothetical protein
MFHSTLSYCHYNTHSSHRVRTFVGLIQQLFYLLNYMYALVRTFVALVGRLLRVLVGGVLAGAADGAASHQRHVVVRHAPAALHAARQGDRTLLGDLSKVRLVLPVPGV